MSNKNRPLKQKPTPRFQSAILIIVIIILLYAFVNSVIADILIKKNGQCIKAYIYKENPGTRTSPDFSYRFLVDCKTYKGVMSIVGNNKVGDSVCIVYFITHPDFNRPISYFDKGKINCDCK